MMGVKNFAWKWNKTANSLSMMHVVFLFQIPTNLWIIYVIALSLWWSSNISIRRLLLISQVFRLVFCVFMVLCLNSFNSVSCVVFWLYFMVCLFFFKSSRCKIFRMLFSMCFSAVRSFKGWLFRLDYLLTIWLSIISSMPLSLWPRQGLSNKVSWKFPLQQAVSKSLTVWS